MEVEGSTRDVGRLFNLARRWKMALKQSAPIAVRAGKAWIVAAIAGALLTTAGCNHRRSSLRPVFTAPRAVSAPCTNCGNGASATIAPESGTTIIREGSSATRGPITSEPGGSLDSAVPSLDAPVSETTPTSRRSSTSEKPPKATIDGALDADPYPATSSSSAAKRSQSLRPSYESGSKAGSSSPKTSPLLQGPGSTGSTSYKSDSGVRSTSATGVVRRTSMQESLKSFFGKDGGDELFFPNKADRPWKYIVLHHSATDSGSYDAIDAEHRKVLGFDGCGYHFVIGNGTGSGDGQIEVAQRWVNQKHGVHCRNARKSEIDEYGIGICLVGDFDKAPPTPRQLAAARALVTYLSRKYEIADDRVETHAHLAATPTVCPGKHFPTGSLLSSPAREVQVDRPEPESRPVPTVWKARTTSRQSQGGTPVY
jgi:N-acetylmuramoyl-L-alanine amidase